MALSHSKPIISPWFSHVFVRPILPVSVEPSSIKGNQARKGAKFKIQTLPVVDYASSVIALLPNRQP